MTMPTQTHDPVHHELIKPFQGLLRTGFLYDMDSKYAGDRERCTVFAISSYVGHYPTFKVILDSDGSLFDYIPATAIIHPAVEDDSLPLLGLHELTHGIVCPSEYAVINRFKFLMSLPPESRKFMCWFPKQKVWIPAHEYICTIDWHTENENLHLVSLSNGQLAFVPNHKCLFTAKDQWPLALKPYRAISSLWQPHVSAS